MIRELGSAVQVVTSSITPVECARGISRARSLGRLTAAEELAALRLLDVAEQSWHVHDLSEAIMALARAPFPVEPLRTLAALHVATAQVFHEALGDVTMLSFDDRVRENARALGLTVAPEALP